MVMKSDMLSERESNSLLEPHCLLIQVGKGGMQHLG